MYLQDLRGKRCSVVSSKGTTVGRIRSGLLHHFPSALPSGAKTRDVSGSAQSYCILDCIFHEGMMSVNLLDLLSLVEAYLGLDFSFLCVNEDHYIIQLQVPGSRFGLPHSNLS